MIEKLHRISKWQRIIGLLGLYGILLIFSTWAAYGVRFDFDVPIDHQLCFREKWPWIWVVQITFLVSAGQFSSRLSFFSIPDLKKLGIGIGAILGGLLVIWHIGDNGGILAGISRGVIVLDGILAFLSLATCRLLFRVIRQEKHKSDGQGRKIGIAGAGEAGAALARELQSKGELLPVVFFDDDESKKGLEIHGVQIQGRVEEVMSPQKMDLTEIIIAMPSASSKRVREISEYVEKQGYDCRTIPTLSQLATGDMVSSVRPLEIRDILGREPANLAAEGLEDFYSGKCVLVTGAGGSIGSELCRQLKRCGVSRLVLLERSESALFDIHSELGEAINCVPELADITDSHRLRQVLQEHRPAAVFHAAAFKHVGLLERQPAVALRNNVLSTHILAKLAREQKVDRVVLVSTDKAVEPANVMGATKRLAEKLMEGHALESSGTRFISVRFGNVLGSSGSVVPIFERQIAAGGPVTVRDAAVTRYFMSIPEAAGLVLCSGMLGENGDRFILEMGEPVKILDLAEQMIRFSGKITGQDIAIEITGLGPGEKQHEKLYASEEQLEATSHPKIYRVQGGRMNANAWRHIQDQMALLKPMSDSDAKAWLQKMFPDFRAK